MTKAAEQVPEQAMRFDPADRAELIDRLFEAATPSAGVDDVDDEAGGDSVVSDDPAYVAAWAAEPRERLASVERREEKPIPWREAMAQTRRGMIDGE